MGIKMDVVETITNQDSYFNDKHVFETSLPLVQVNSIIRALIGRHQQRADCCDMERPVGNFLPNSVES